VGHDHGVVMTGNLTSLSSVKNFPGSRERRDERLYDKRPKACPVEMRCISLGFNPLRAHRIA